MTRSKLYVDPKVNFSLIVSDRRSTDHVQMAKTLDFSTRLDEAVAAANLNSRTALAAALGAGENPKQVAGQWVKREKVPDKYTRQLAALGISIDYINTGEGAALLAAVPPSQPVRGVEERMAKAGDLVITQFEQWGVEFRPREDLDLIVGVYEVLVGGSTVIDATKWLIREVEHRGLGNVRQGEVGANRR